MLIRFWNGLTKPLNGSRNKGVDMTTVTYTFYGKYRHQKTFETYQAAKKFFWVIQKARGVTSVNLDYPQEG